MPAIQLARLKRQTASLVEYFGQPTEFIYELHALLDYYSDRTQRPGQAGEPPPLLRSFKVPKPVIRQLTIELEPLANSQPEEALKLADALWIEPYLETRTLAASLLGLIPPNPPEAILGKVQAWMKTDIDDKLMIWVLSQGLGKIRLEDPDMLLNQIEEWMNKPDRFFKLVGLRALIPLLSSQQYDNLPVFFHLLAPFTRRAPLELRPDILDCLGALAGRSPKETAYFLHQNLDAPENPDTAKLIRQCLPVFPHDLQEGLRTALREASTEKSK